MSDNNEQHQMRLEKTHPSGAEEWSCPTCGRRFLMQYPPKYKKIVMEVGDEYAAHSGGKGGLQMGPVQISQEEDYELSDELRNALNDALSDIDLDDWATPPA
jgi:DNA-directed RNA polymerase subunit RPC12/RpoP